MRTYHTAVTIANADGVGWHLGLRLYLFTVMVVMVNGVVIITWYIARKCINSINVKLKTVTKLYRKFICEKYL